MSPVEFATGALVSLRHLLGRPPPLDPPDRTPRHGGLLRLPDPDTFGGTVSLSAADAAWDDRPASGAVRGAQLAYAAPDRANTAARRRRPRTRAPREAGGARLGAFALHVLEIMEAIMQAADGGAAVAVPGGVDGPPLLGEEEARSFGR